MVHSIIIIWTAEVLLETFCKTIKREMQVKIYKTRK